MKILKKGFVDTVAQKRLFMGWFIKGREIKLNNYDFFVLIEIADSKIIGIFRDFTNHITVFLVFVVTSHCCI